MSDTDMELLARYTRQHAEDAFAEIVRRHLGLVYSTALRQVRSPPLAEEVAQSVFIDLARSAAKLKFDTILTAWLYQVTRRTAIDVVRREASRQLRESRWIGTTERNAMNATAADWTHIEPLLDEAMHALDDTDRAAVLLRYFENKSLREVGATLGTSENAAQKRLGRAVERLREFFAKRGVTVGASGLVVVISANGVQAAPVGLVLTISTAAALGGTTIAATATATATKAIAMTVTQKVLIATVLAAAVGTGIYHAREASTLRTEGHRLRQQAPLPEPIQQLTGDGGDSARQLAALRNENERLNRNTAELAKLRGEITALRNRAPELTQEKTIEIEKENKALRAKTNQLWQSLVGYINTYSNSIAPDKRWAYSLEERKRFSLAQAEDGRYLLRRKGSEGTDNAFNGGEFTSIGIGPNHIFVRQPADKDEPEGWRIIDLRSGAVNGPYADGDFTSRPEVVGVRFMKPEEAWESMK